MELIHKYMKTEKPEEHINEENEIVELLNELDVKKTVRDVKRAGTRIADTRICAKLSQAQKYGCMIKVYRKYIGSMKGELSRASSDGAKATIKDKIAKAEARIKKWEEADKASKTHKTISRLGGKSKSTGVKTSKAKKKSAEKSARKGGLGGFKI